MNWRWLPWQKPRDGRREGTVAKNEATQKLEETREQGLKVDALAARLHDQLHRRNQLGKLFDEAFRGVK